MMVGFEGARSVGELEGEGSQGANRGADSKELGDAYRSAIDAACEAKNQKESARGSGRCDERPTARRAGMTAQESNIAVDTNGNRTSAEASPEGSNQFDG
jgi:hypothetical protein